MTGVEAAGELVTGALIAGAIERAGGEHGARHATDQMCLNCGTALLGDYCHRCGQPEHIHRSLSAIWHDLAHGVLHFEGKIWNTLPMLAWRPGELTRRFIHGERARFVSPMALFLFSVFLMFALFSAIGAHLEVPVKDGKISSKAFQVDGAGLRGELARIDAEIAKRRAAGQDVTELRQERESVAGLAVMVGGGTSTRLNAKRDLTLNTGIARLDTAFKKANENPNLILYKLQSNAYKLSWALIPISTPFVWLMFAWKRRFKVYDHAVFVTYSLSFMSLFVILLTLLSQLAMPSAVIALAAIFVPPIHMYRQLRGAYQTGRWSTVVRTSALVIFSFWVLVAYGLLLLTLGMLG